MKGIMPIPGKDPTWFWFLVLTYGICKAWKIWMGEEEEPKSGSPQASHTSEAEERGETESERK
ncbi:MAG TPA: hypothetical protein PKO06_04245 [Candidatus Ozemobacteraceae bacterium]|mgnify:CR=1 FL=1|nr:hypothetical protein [Candidatus Ozemobacteraceae bacterium]